MKQVDFEHGSTWRNILQSAVPMLVAQFFNLLYNIVDRIFIARIPGEGTVALGAVGLCFPIVVMVSAFANLFGTGGAPLFSIALGAGKEKDAVRIQKICFFLLTSAALVIMTAGTLFARPLLQLFGASDTAMTYALPYLRIYFLGTFCSMISVGLNPFINAQGFTRVGMATVITGAASNLILDPLFIFGLNMNVQGAALATILSQGLSAGLVLFFLFSKRAQYRLAFLKKVDFRGIGKDIRDIMGLGFVGFIMQFQNSIVQIVGNAMLVAYGGDLFVSVMTIVASVRQMLELPVLAVGEGTAPVMSYNYGAGRGGKVKECIKISAIIMLAYTLLTWLFVLWKPELLIGIFSSDKTLLKDAVPALHIYFFAFIFQGLQYSGQSTFKALNKKGRAIFFSLLRKAVLVIPLTLLLPGVFGFGTNGVFLAEPISNLIGGTASFTTMLITMLPELSRLKEVRKAE